MAASWLRGRPMARMATIGEFLASASMHPELPLDLKFRSITTQRVNKTLAPLPRLPMAALSSPGRHICRTCLDMVFMPSALMLRALLSVPNSRWHSPLPEFSLPTTYGVPIRLISLRMAISFSPGMANQLSTAPKSMPASSQLTLHPTPFPLSFPMAAVKRH